MFDLIQDLFDIGCPWKYVMGGGAYVTDDTVVPMYRRHSEIMVHEPVFLRLSIL